MRAERPGFTALLAALRYYLAAQPTPIWRKVRFILCPMGFWLFGIWWSQFAWVSPFITSKLPCGKVIERFLCAAILCFNLKMRSWPKLTEAMQGAGPSSASSSLCHATPSAPSRYRFSNTQLKEVFVQDSTLSLISRSALVQGRASSLSPEYR